MWKQMSSWMDLSILLLNGLVGCLRSVSLSEVSLERAGRGVQQPSETGTVETQLVAPDLSPGPAGLLPLGPQQL